MLTELIDKIDVSPELMMHLAQQLGELVRSWFLILKGSVFGSPSERGVPYKAS